MSASGARGAGVGAPERRDVKDACCWVGPGPHLDGRHADALSAAPLRELLRRGGIAAGLVSPAAGLTARTQEEADAANATLATLPVGGPLVPAPVVAVGADADPEVAGRSVIRLAATGARAVRIRLDATVPGDAAAGTACLVRRTCAAVGLPLVVHVRVADPRCVPALPGLDECGDAAIAMVARAAPGVPLLVTGVPNGRHDGLLALHPDVVVDTAFLDGPDAVRRLVARAGADRVAFSGHAPYLSPGAGLAKVHGLSEEDARAVLGGTLASFGIAADRR